jgi:GAF domain-containing protein
MTEIKGSGGYDAAFAHVMAEAVRTLASDFEFLDLAHQLTVSTVSLLGAGAAGVMLEDAAGRLQVLSASDEDTRLLEIFELQREEGPCYECWRSGTVVTAPDILAGGRWPGFVKEARTLGFVSAAAVPLRLRARVVGALNVFWTTPWTVSAQDMDAVQALADVAAVGLVQQRLARESGVVAEQLENALHSRVTIEQAKGLMATKAHVDIDDAFGILEAYAVATGSSVVAVAQDVVDRIVTWQDGALRPA